MHFLVTGGAGYIGSHFVKAALHAGHHCTVIDDFSTGHEWAVPNQVNLKRHSLLDTVCLKQTIYETNYDIVIHFASSIVVSESNKKSLEYYQNNFIALWNLLSISSSLSKIRPLIFSSTAAIFGGESISLGKLKEDSQIAPQSVYGRSKLFCEYLLQDYSRNKQVQVISLRYFNACGADESGEIGEAHIPETHLLPNLISACLEGKEFTLYGNDYPTKDGSCIRDYIHVTDLAKAHLLAVDRIRNKQSTDFFEAFNLGTGDGFSNLEVLKSVEHVAGKTIQYKVAERREGDASYLVCDPTKAKEILGFHPKYVNLDDIVKTALNWHKRWILIQRGNK